MWASRLTKLRRTAIFTALSNSLVIILGGFLIIEAYPFCDRQYVLPFVLVSVAALVRIGVMIQTGIAQETTAKCILQSPSDGTVVADQVIRREIRIRYKKWLWWSRLSMVVLVLQVVCATYLILETTKYFSKDGTSSGCGLELDSKSSWGTQMLLASFMIMICFVALVQCFSGFDVLKWRTFYETHDNAWKHHYREVFDHGLREILCCLGVQWKKMKSIQLRSYWLILLHIVHLAPGIWSSWQVYKTFLHNMVWLISLHLYHYRGNFLRESRFGFTSKGEKIFRVLW